MQKTWFISGASRGLGVEIAEAATRTGDRVVAAGRNSTTLIGHLGCDSDRLLSVQLGLLRVAVMDVAPSVTSAMLIQSL